MNCDRSYARCRNCYYWCIETEACKINFPKSGQNQPHMDHDDWCGQFQTDGERANQIPKITALRDGVMVDSAIRKAILKDLADLIERGVKAVPMLVRGYYDFSYRPAYRNSTFFVREEAWSFRGDHLFGGAHCDCRYSYFFGGQEVSLENWCIVFLKEVGHFPRYYEDDERTMKAFYDKYLAFRPRWYAKKVKVCDNCQKGEHLPYFRYKDLDLEWEHVMVANRDITLEEWKVIYEACLKSIPPAKPQEEQPQTESTATYVAPKNSFWSWLFGGGR